MKNVITIGHDTLVGGSIFMQVIFNTKKSLKIIKKEAKKDLSSFFTAFNTGGVDLSRKN